MQLEDVRANEISDVVEKIRAWMEEYGLSIDDIEGKRRRGRPAGSGGAKAVTQKEPLPPKYLAPKTGKTWSGRGRAPAWLGKRPERFLIQE